VCVCVCVCVDVDGDTCVQWAESKSSVRGNGFAQCPRLEDVYIVLPSACVVLLVWGS
jgi:hypothetical protein